MSTPVRLRILGFIDDIMGTYLSYWKALRGLRFCSLKFISIYEYKTI